MRFPIAGMDMERGSHSAPASTDSQLKVHTGWVNVWQNVIIELDAYVRDFHPRGLKWKKGN